MTTTSGSITGSNLIAGIARGDGPATLFGVDARTGETNGVAHHAVTADEIRDATRAASEAFAVLRAWTPPARAALLDAIADRLEAAGPSIVARADIETALGAQPRLEGELARTTGQLRSFARFVREGSYVEAVIDTGTPDLRRMLVPIGPVAVFGASNFPLAFGVAGGDTAAALAAGCPVIAKGHPSHPGTSELVARAVLEACASVDAPAGTFSLVQGSGIEVGQQLVLDPEVRAVGFTGSLTGGRALADLAATRETPIPVFAEMGSINPVFVLPEALANRGASIAAGYAGSMTQGGGQFCTKPGVVFVPEGAPGDTLVAALATALREVAGVAMLNDRILEAYSASVDEISRLDGVEVAYRGEPDAARRCTPALLTTDIDTFLSQPRLHDETFGPCSLVVRCPADRFADAAAALPGSLTATLHSDPGDVAHAGDVQAALVERAGRVLHNGYPTGVAVSPAMHHGGPYPATSSPAHTSVGMTAITRFLRPVALQDAPAALLPAALADDNPLGIVRLVDWEWTREPVAGSQG